MLFRSDRFDHRTNNGNGAGDRWASNNTHQNTGNGWGDRWSSNPRTGSGAPGSTTTAGNTTTGSQQGGTHSNSGWQNRGGATGSQPSTPRSAPTMQANRSFQGTHVAMASRPAGGSFGGHGGRR